MAAMVVVIAGVAVQRVSEAAQDNDGGGKAPQPAYSRSQVTASTVTLITGDKVTVVLGGVAGETTERFSVQPGAGRGNITFSTHRVGGHLHVVPSDAVVLLDDSLLDQRLFDVTTLLEYGYSDSTTTQLPLIITAKRGGTSAGGTSAGGTGGGIGGGIGKARSRAASAGTKVVRELPGVGAVAVRQDRDQAPRVWQNLTTPTAGSANRALRPELGKIFLDGRRRPALDTSGTQVGAPIAWQSGYTGSGVTVAVLDTGIDATHPDLAGKVIAQRNFTEGSDAAEDSLDHAGHGTHVASIVAGSGAASGGRYRGVAPGAKLLDGKVCRVGGCAESWILAGISWAVTEQKAKVVNLSLADVDTAETDPIEEAVETLSETHGTLFVVSAGNDGGDAIISTPGSAPAALTVGSVDDSDALADHSNRGPRSWDDGLKPDLTAPGVDITAALSATHAREEGLQGQYLAGSGTSMAAPHVAGAAAIIAQIHPDWTGQQIKSTLMASAKPNPDLGVFAQGSGRLDIARAIGQTVTADPPSVSFGRQLWPYSDDETLNRGITYHNYGTTAVDLVLALDLTGPDGSTAPPGMFALSTSALSVPAGGTASVTLTVDTRVAGPDGITSGHLTATTAAAGQAVSTALAVTEEAESYDLTFHQIGRDGRPATGDFYTYLYGEDGSYQKLDDPDGDGTITMRARKGRYFLSSVEQASSEEAATVLLVDPKFEVTRARNIELDARLGKPISVNVPDRSVAPTSVTVTARWNPVGVDASISGRDPRRMYTAQLGETKTVDDITSTISITMAKPTVDGDRTGSPVVYHLFWPRQGQVFTGFQRDVATRDLAVVRAEYAAAFPGGTGVVLAYASLSTSIDPAMIDLPFTRSEYYNTDGETRWAKDFWATATGERSPLNFLGQSNLGYRAGRAYQETWNRGVFGPAFPTVADPAVANDRITRQGNLLFVDVPQFSDGAGRAAGSRVADASTTVYRDGAKIAEAAGVDFGRFEVPAEESTYRIEVRAERVAPFAMSTRIETAWTFRSRSTVGDTLSPVPAWVVRFTPGLDLDNNARAGGSFTVPVRVVSQPGAKVGRLEQVDVEVSYDDGVTWQRAESTGRSIVLHHPVGTGYVSLRAKATDTCGNTVEQTIIRGYRYLPLPA